MIISCSNAVLYSVAYNLSFLFRGELSTGRPTWFIQELMSGFTAHKLLVQTINNMSHLPFDRHSGGAIFVIRK